MKKLLLCFVFLFFCLFAGINVSAQTFSLESITSYLFISEVATSAKGQITAFCINKRELRNIYVAEETGFTLHKITNYNKDEGQEITGLNISPDGKWIEYVRDADHGAFDESDARNSSSLRGKIICVDPGHGGTASTDHYRVGPGGEREEWINLRVAQLLKKKLEEKGAKVIMTRTDDTFIPLNDRSKIAVINKADVFISIHHNATADTSVNFPIIYFHGAASENLAGVALGKDVALALQKYFYNKKISESLNSDYTIFPENGAAVLRNTYGIPAVLGEASFFTNPSEETRLKQEDYNSLEATAYLKALELFFNKPIPVIKPMQIPERIVPFKVFEEAERMNQAALDWEKDFTDGEKLMNSNDTNDLRKALNLFTLSAKYFPDSFLARDCHLHRAALLEKLNEPEKAKEERIRVKEFYVNLN